MELLLKDQLGTAKLKQFGSGGGGCISRGQGYDTDEGKVYVKFNSESGARLMFDGEYAGLEAMLATGTLRVPKPIKAFDDPSGGAVLVMEYLEMTGLSKHSGMLGEQLANYAESSLGNNDDQRDRPAGVGFTGMGYDCCNGKWGANIILEELPCPTWSRGQRDRRMHLHNAELKKAAEKQASSVHGDTSSYVDKFGFHTTTCCGYIPQDNTWTDDWVTFFTRQKLQQQVDLILNKSGDRDVKEAWPKLERKIPEYFKGIEIVPALLHGDLWGGNAAEIPEGPVLFDCACFYGHAEFEMGIATMFGGFGSRFFESYHKLIPKQPGHDQRLRLYQLFHYLNHWNHFGSGYKSSSMSIMRELGK